MYAMCLEKSKSLGIDVLVMIPEQEIIQNIWLHDFYNS